MSGYGYVEQYRDDAGEFRWRAIAGNGQTIADSAEGYTTPTGCAEGLEALVRLLTGGERSLAPDVRWSDDEQTRTVPDAHHDTAPGMLTDELQVCLHVTEGAPPCDDCRTRWGVASVTEG